jgi:type IV secretory pathway VirB2 component (pilin)
VKKIGLFASKVFPSKLRTHLLRIGTALVLAVPAYAQAGGSPWENAVNALKTSFTGPIATGLSLVAIVVGGLMFAFGEGQSKKVFAGIVFGIGIGTEKDPFVGADIVDLKRKSGDITDPHSVCIMFTFT